MSKLSKQELKDRLSLIEQHLHDLQENLPDIIMTAMRKELIKAVREQEPQDNG